MYGVHWDNFLCLIRNNVLIFKAKTSINILYIDDIKDIGLQF